MNFFLKFVKWYYLKIPKNIIKIWINYLLFSIHFFSVPILIRSLFAPWKRISILQKGGGLQTIFDVVTFNLISRSIGFISRISLIFAAVFFFLFIFIFGIFFFFFWLVLPFNLFAYFVVYFFDWQHPHSLFYLLFLLIIGLPIVFIFIQDQKLPLPLEVLLKSKKRLNELLKYLLNTNEGKFVQNRLYLKETKLTVLKRQEANNENFKRFTHILSELLKKQQKKIPEISDLFYCLSLTWPAFKDFLLNEGLSENDILETCLWYERLQAENIKIARFWEQDNLLRTPALGSDLVYGYTPDLDNFSYNLAHSSIFTGHIIGRRKEIEELETILMRATQNNALLFGEPGVGRHTTATGLAHAIYEGKVYPQLKGKKILLLNMTSILGISQEPTQGKKKLSELIAQARNAGNIILVIDNLEKYVGRDAKINITETLVESLQVGRLQIIGIATTEGFYESIRPNAQLMKLFDAIQINPMNEEETLITLEHLSFYLQRQLGILITYQALKEAIDKSRYLNSSPLPERAIDTLDEVATYVVNKKIDRFLLPSHLHTYISEKGKVPLGILSSGEKQKLADLENLIHKRLINQEQAVLALSKALRRRRLGITVKNSKPIGSFLFLGPTGVGKTETAKTLAEAYFGSENNLTRLDMSQFKEEGAIENLIGSQQYSGSGVLIKAILDKPFTVLLLDEIEKAHQNILNLLLTVLDEGYITDPKGKKVSFENTIIIATSNAAAEYIREKVNKNISGEELSKLLIDYVQKEKIFNPEFLNRFDAVIVYKPLTKTVLKQIAKNQLQRLTKHLFNEKGIQLIITDDLVDFICNKGYDPTLGARPMNRAIANYVEDYLAKKFLDGEIKHGDSVQIPLEDLQNFENKES